MFKKFMLAAALALPLMGALPATEAKADAPTAALQSTVQTVQNAANQNIRTVRTVRVVRRGGCGRHFRHVHGCRVVHYRR
jgi:hypothetical protein